LLLSSPPLREKLQLEKTVKFFRSQVLEPLRQVFHRFESDLASKGGEGVIEAAVGEEMCQVGNARCVGLIGLTLDQIEETISDAFGSDEADLSDHSQTDETKVLNIQKQMNVWK
jgi:hypothetical protein